MATDELVIYLNDHLAGATGALSLLDRLISGSESDSDRRFLLGLKGEIGEDVSTLTDLIARVGGQRSAVRQAGGWLSEKFATLKMRVDDPGGQRLNHFEALEMLALGILGKRALWRALRGASADVPALGALDLDRLEARAQDQHDRLDARRIEAGRRIFTTTKDQAALAK